MTGHPPATVVVVGAGPRGVGFLERLGASAPELLPGRRIDVHLVDPYPPGPGRVWRRAQSPLLLLNSMAEDITMFTDDSVCCAGPARPGPSMAEWAASLPDDAELRGLTGRTFPTRRLASRYLAWVFDHVRAHLPAGVTVAVHPRRVERVTGPPGGRPVVWLAGRADPLVADALVLALGHLDAAPSGEPAELARFAAAHGAHYQPPAYTADVDLSWVPAGELVLVRGLGLAFVDLMVLLTEGRGGRYRTGPDGALTYLPSGREPVLYAGSRRGVPHHAKTTYRLLGPPPPLPRFFGPEQVAALLAHGELDFGTQVWPLLAKETAGAYYHELFAAHADRVAMPAAEFDARFAALDWDTDERRELVRAAVPAPADRIDFDRLDRPLRGLRFATPEALQEHVREYVRADLARRSDPAHSADLGAFLGLLSAYAQLPAVVASGLLTARSRLAGHEGWWTALFNHLVSGPPGDRLDRLVALSNAGLVRFLGADLWVRPDPATGGFLAGSASTDRVVAARALIEARQPVANVEHSADGLMRWLRDSGGGIEEVLADGRGTGLLATSVVDGRALGRDGLPQRRTFALGPFTTMRTPAAFARPRSNAAAFADNDATARAVLQLLR